MTVLAVVAYACFVPALTIPPIQRLRRHRRWYRAFTNPPQESTPS